MINLLIVDDSAIIRKSLQTIVEQDREIKVIGNAANGKTAAVLCASLRPDLVLMDIRMPVCDGVEGTRLIKQLNRTIKVLILTIFNDDDYIATAVRHGADGYLLKDTEDTVLIAAIKNVMKGYAVLQASAFEKLKAQYSIEDNSINHSQHMDLDLTGREQDIIKLIVDGFSNKEIASKLGIAEGTTRNHISLLLEKLHLADRTQLAVFAIKNTLV